MADSEYTPTDKELVWQFDQVTGLHWAAINTDQLAAHCANVRAEERERCAAVADQQVQKWYPDSGRYGRVASENIAAAIRALPSTPETGETK